MKRKRKTGDIASFFFSKGAVKKSAEAEREIQDEQTGTDSESECPVVPSQPPGIQTLSHLHLAILLPSLTISTSVMFKNRS